METESTDIGFKKFNDDKGVPNFSCTHCGHSLKSKQGIINHIIRQHPRDNIKTATKRGNSGEPDDSEPENKIHRLENPYESGMRNAPQSTQNEVTNLDKAIENLELPGNTSATDLDKFLDEENGEETPNEYTIDLSNTVLQALHNDVLNDDMLFSTDTAEEEKGKKDKTDPNSVVDNQVNQDDDNGTEMILLRAQVIGLNNEIQNKDIKIMELEGKVSGYEETIMNVNDKVAELESTLKVKN